MAKVTISEAEEGDVASLTTILPRAFHPINPFMRKLLPDTPRIREWWQTVFTSARADPDSHVLTAIDEGAQDSAKRAVGVLCLQLCGGPDDRGAEFWTKHELTPDHDAELFAKTMAPMIGPRARLMQGRKHHLVQFFGVDHAYQGTGVGKMLLQRACDIADQDNHDMFVEANMRAAPFYMKFGFELLEEHLVPGDPPYPEGLLVRRYKPPQK